MTYILMYLCCFYAQNAALAASIISGYWVNLAMTARNSSAYRSRL